MWLFIGGRQANTARSDDPRLFRESGCSKMRSLPELRDLRSGLAQDHARGLVLGPF
jgi:hypothetical protein